MGDHGCTIFLQHEHAQDFFVEAMNPDFQELQRRDAFLSELEAEYRIRTEGVDLVMKIPDLILF
ncbi:MAG: hypothetical protein HFF73_14510 [Oscillospiraceae bacterium]|jgi:hypothetical protein|nr:hypothetical protein [Oscillospiraceae bacterium]